MNALPATTNTKSGWGFKHLGAAWLSGILLQSLRLPCLCSIGVAQSNFALVFDALVLLRMLIARHRHDTGKGWIFYAALCLSSPVWIEGLTRLVLGGH